MNSQQIKKLEIWLYDKYYYVWNEWWEKNSNIELDKFLIGSYYYIYVEYTQEENMN
jgi:hypothetical protein